MKPNWRLIGFFATVVSVGLTLVTNKVEEEKMIAEVKKTVNEVLAERENEEESE